MRGIPNPSPGAQVSYEPSPIKVVEPEAVPLVMTEGEFKDFISEGGTLA